MSSDSQMVEKKKNKRQPTLWDTSQIYIFLYFKFNWLTEEELIYLYSQNKNVQTCLDTALREVSGW